MPATVVSQATVRSNGRFSSNSTCTDLFTPSVNLHETHESLSGRMDVPARVILWQDGCPSTHTAVIL